MDEEKIVYDIVDSFMEELTQFRSPDLNQFLAKCPDELKCQLRRKLRAVELVFRHRYSSRVSAATLESTKERISEMRHVRDRVRAAQAEMMQPPQDLQTEDPVSRMAIALQILTVLNTGGPPPQSRQLRLHRGVPGGEAATKAIERTSLLMYRKRGVDQADSLLKELGLSEVPVALDTICAHLNIIVSYQPMEDGIDGALVTDGQVGGVVINSSVTSETRRRFTLAHEIGHFVMHRHMHWIVEGEEAFEGTGRSTEEVEANAFAGALLMPSSLMADKRSHEPRLSEFDDIADTFNVSLSAAATRFVSVSDWPCAFVALHDGVVRWVVWSEHFQGFIKHRGKPHPTTGAALLFQNRGKAEFTQHLPLAAWLGNDTSDEAECLEDSRRVGNDWVYSLISMAE